MFIRSIEDWSAESPDYVVLNNKELMEIAKEIHKKDFEEWLEDIGKNSLADANDKFADFVSDFYSQDPDLVSEIIDEWCKMHNYKATFVDWEYNDVGNHTFFVREVIPQTKEELVELVENFLKETKGMEGLAEPIVDKIIKDVGSKLKCK